MALTWIDHDTIEDNAVVVQYSIETLQAQVVSLENDAIASTAASAAATAEAAAIDARLVIYLGTPGRP